MSARIAVTGASGFVGRHVVQALSRTSAEVVAATRTPAKLADLSCKIEVVALDIGKPSGDAYLQLGRPDILVHLAWDGLPNYRSLHHIDRELPTHFRFLAGMVEAGLQSIVVAGTCLEYGMQFGPLSEDMICHPDTAYALAKHTLQRQLEFLQREKAFRLTWARLFYTYGEGQAPSSLWTQLNAALDRDDQSFNMSGGEQLRDFLPISEMARLLAELALRNLDAGAVNICSGQPKSVRRFVEERIAETGKSMQINAGYYPYPDYEPMAFWGTTQKLTSILGAQQ